MSLLGEIEPEDYYPTFLEMVRNLLDGNVDSVSYEDSLREMFGIHAYISFTLDKVVINSVRQLQHLVTDEAAVECHDLFTAEAKNGATGGTCGTAHERLIPELVYQKRAEKLLDDENCFKIVIYHQSRKLTIELLDTDSDGQNSDEEAAEAKSKGFHSYVDRFILPGETISDKCRQRLERYPGFLRRGVRTYRPMAAKRREVNIYKKGVEEDGKGKEKAGEDENSEAKTDSDPE